ncbi:MAG: GWxTD domain-containing protein [Vicinamibacteria bacterium]|jgi:GWxTD domain-containing protein|nr:GWxTD domain-containing protein [Vicinamibacteria bacterium]
MRIRTRTFAAGLTAALALVPDAALALDKDAKKWQEGVQILMLPAEEKVYKDLKDKGDIAEFQKIFWKRRDPDLDTPENEYQKQFEALKLELAAKYKVAGKDGARTDCARVHVLFGAPTEVKEMGEAQPGRLAPTRWIWVDEQTKQPRGQADFDELCQLPQGTRIGEQLVRAAEAKIVYPSLDYKRGKDGKLVKLEDQLPKPTPIQALLKAPRQDFAFTAEPLMMIKGQGGATYIAGVASLPVEGLDVQDVLGKKMVRLEVAALALDEAGKAVGAERERETLAEVGADGKAAVSFRAALKPGKYTLRVAVHDKKTAKGSVVEMAGYEVPDLGAGLHVTGMLSRGIVSTPGETPDTEHPFSDFTLIGGGNKVLFTPVPGGRFAKTDKLDMIAWVYGMQAEAAPAADPAAAPAAAPAAGKAKVVISTALLQAGRTKAKADDATYDRTEQVLHQVGPIDLAAFGPGKYTVQFKVKDLVAGKDFNLELPFEVLP